MLKKSYVVRGYFVAITVRTVFFEIYRSSSNRFFRQTTKQLEQEGNKNKQLEEDLRFLRIVESRSNRNFHRYN